jgi:hypothetical protein
VKTPEKLRRLWRDGPEPGEGRALARGARGHPTVLVFSRIAQLVDDEPVGGTVPGLEHADTATLALAAVVERWRRLDARPVRGDGGGQAVRAWAALAQSHGELAAGQRDPARDRLRAVLADEAAPRRARMAAGWAVAGPEAGSSRSERIDALLAVAAIAPRPHDWPAEAAAALLEIAAGRRGAGHQRLLRLAATDSRPEVVPALLEDLLEQGLASSARRRDDWAHALLTRIADGCVTQPR